MPENFNWNELENNWWFHSFDNYINGGALYQALVPGEVQYSEFSQQMLASMYQNHWNSEQERMRRMQEAGINPYAAAQGIAGVGGSQGSIASSPNSALGKGAETVSALGNTAANLMTAGGSSFANIAQGISMFSKLRGEIDKIDSETQLNFENLGFTKLQSRALSTQLKYMDWKEKMSCFQALANYNNTVAEYHVIKQDYLNKVEELHKIIADTNLSTSLAEKTDAEKQLTQVNKEWQQMQNDFFSSHGYIAGSSFYEALRDAMVSGQSIDLDKFGDIVAGYEGKIYFARENAAAQASWNRRPSNAYEASAFIGNSLGKRLKEFFARYNPAEAMSKVELEPELKDEFEMAYDEARDKLKENYRSAKKEYKKIKNSGNSMTVAELERKMNNAKDELDSFTKEKFSEILVYQNTGKSSIK